MKRLILLVCVVALVSVSAPAQARSPAPGEDLLGYYDSELMQIHLRGLTSRIAYQGEFYLLGLRAQQQLEPVFSAYPDTYALFKSYERNHRAFNVLYWGGLSLSLVGGPMLLLVAPDLTADDLAFQLLTLGALITPLTSVVFQVRAQRTLSEAVHLFNRNRIKDYAAANSNR